MSQLNLRELAIDREPAPRAAPRRHVVARYVLPGLLLAGFATAMAWAFRDALLPATPVTVLPVHVSRAEVQQAGTPLFRAAGWVEPRPTHVAVAALAAGVVEELLVVEDQAVEAGEPVARLVDDDARLQVRIAEADLALRQAELKQATAALAAAQTRFEQPVHLEAELAEAEARLAAARTKTADLPYQTRSAEARLRFAQSDYEGKSQAGQAVSGRALEQSRAELDAARAAVEQLQRQEASLAAEIDALTKRRDALQRQLALKTEEKRQLDEARGLVEAATARVQQAEAARDEAQLRLDRMTIRTSVAGRVYDLWASPGTRLEPGMGHDERHDGTTVITLYQPDRLQVRVDVRFEDLPQIRRGQPALVESPAVANPLEGEVLFLSSLADIQKNTLEVKVSLDTPPAVLKPDMLVDVTFLAPEPPDASAAPEAQDVLYVPKPLVREGDGGPFVWIADRAAGVARKAPVATGRRGTSELIEVTEGLNVSDKLIVDPPDDLSDGSRIRVEGEDAGIGTGEN